MTTTQEEITAKAKALGVRLEIEHALVPMSDPWYVRVTSDGGVDHVHRHAKWCNEAESFHSTREAWDLAVLALELFYVDKERRRARRK